MKCVICKHGETELSTTTMTLERGGAVVAFKEVPAQVCTNCGEAYVDEEISAKLLEDQHRWTGSKRARALLDNWNEARAKFVKVFPNEYKRALGDMAAAEAKPVAAAKPKKAVVKS